MHTSTTSMRPFSGASLLLTVLASSAYGGDLHNYHSNDATEPVIVTLNIDATATADGGSIESPSSFTSLDHPINIAEATTLLEANSQAGGHISSTGSAQIDAEAFVSSSYVSDDFISWQIDCEESCELNGGTPAAPVSTSLDITSALWYTVDLQEPQDIVLRVVSRYYGHPSFFHSEDDTMIASGQIAAWDGSEGTVSGSASFISVDDGHYLTTYGEIWSWRISLPAGRWRLQATFSAAHLHEARTSDSIERDVEYAYIASLQAFNPSYLLPARVDYLEQDHGMLRVMTQSESRSDSNSTDAYNDTISAGLGSGYQVAPWAYSDLTATQYPMGWDDRGFYQVLDAQGRFAADTSHPFETSSIRGQVSSEPNLVMGSRGARFEVSFSSEAVAGTWAEKVYDVAVTLDEHPEIPIEVIEPYWVSADGRRFKFQTSYGQVAIRPLIELRHALTAQGGIAESEPHEFVTMRVTFTFRGDINSDGLVDGTDLATLLSRWGADAIEADLNDDGAVNGQDLAILLSEWS